MIIGIGMDIVAIDRIKKVYSRYGQRLIERILTRSEQAQCQYSESVSFLAKRFAAKEAFSKAMGTGLVGPMCWQAISILRDSKGKPECVIHSRKLRIALDKKGVSQIHISLTDEKAAYAAAFVVLERC